MQEYSLLGIDNVNELLDILDDDNEMFNNTEMEDFMLEALKYTDFSEV